MLRSEYSYGGIPRLSFFWDNPNHAAAVIACFIPILWGLQRIIRHKRSLRLAWYGLLVAEILGVVSLVLTFSRGGGVAWIASLLFFEWVDTRSIGLTKATALRALAFCGPRLLLFTGLSILCGLGARFGEKNDASVMNRLDLWEGGLQLIEASPINGWGKGNSGLAFMQWLQQPDATAGYGGMVNTYLHIAVEFGIPVLMLYGFLLIAPAIYCISINLKADPDTQEKHMQHAYAASLFAFFIASIFSTLWLILGVVWLPASIVLSVLLSANFREDRPVVIRAASTALYAVLASGLVLYSLAHYMNTRSEWRLALTNDGAINLRQNRHPSNNKKITFAPDMQVLGPYYGKEIRSAISEIEQTPSEFTIYPPSIDPSFSQNAFAIIMGKRIQKIKHTAPELRVTLLFPLGAPVNQEDLNPELLILPAYDQIGQTSQASAWRVWASEKKVPTRTIPWAGQDARANLIEVIQHAMDDVVKGTEQ